MATSKVAAQVYPSPGDSDEDDEDAIIAALEDDDKALDRFREQRLQQLHAERLQTKRLRQEGYGVFTEIKDEKELLDITTSTKLCIVHFFKPDFNRCQIMNWHLEALAEKHLETRFLRINVENAPFLVTKILGFEGLGNVLDKFTTRDLESRLLQVHVLVAPKLSDDSGPSRKSLVKSSHNKEADEDEDEWE